MANSKYLKRRFSLREIIFMIILVAVLFFGLYFWLVYYPIQDRIAEFNAKKDELQLAIDVDKARETQYDKMKAELDEIMKEEAPTRMPKFDNINNLTDKFAEIFADKNANEGINYNAPSLKDGIYERTLQFTFKATGYEDAKGILLQLLGTGYRCLMSNLSFQPDGNLNDGSVSVSTTITFYEVS